MVKLWLSQTALFLLGSVQLLASGEEEQLRRRSGASLVQVPGPWVGPAAEVSGSVVSARWRLE